jgi:putative transposase
VIEDLLAARGLVVSHETVRRWTEKFGRNFAITSNGEKHWLWRAVDQHGFVLDALVHSRRDRRAGERLLRKLMRKQARAARVLVTDKLRYYGAARTAWA